MPPCKLPSLRTISQPVVDVLVLYTQNAMFDSTSLAGAERSSSQMETDIAASYQGANDALAASGVDFSVRLVHMREVLTGLAIALLSAKQPLPDKVGNILRSGRKLRLAGPICQLFLSKNK